MNTAAVNQQNVPINPLINNNNQPPTTVAHHQVFQGAAPAGSAQTVAGQQLNYGAAPSGSFAPGQPGKGVQQVGRQTSGYDSKSNSTASECSPPHDKFAGVPGQTRFPPRHNF